MVAPIGVETRALGPIPVLLGTRVKIEEDSQEAFHACRMPSSFPKVIYIYIQVFETLWVNGQCLVQRWWKSLIHDPAKCW